MELRVHTEAGQMLRERSLPAPSTDEANPLPPPAPRRFASTDSATMLRVPARNDRLRWLVIGDQRVPVAAALDRPSTPVSWTSADRQLDAAQVSAALRAQAPDLLAAFTRRFARDIGFELCALHCGQKRAYLDVQPARAQFWPPATFCLDPYGGERSLTSPVRQEPIGGGAFGFAPEEQVVGAANLSAFELRAIDTFGWAASVAAFATGEPLLPVWQAAEPSRPWLSHILRMQEASPNEIRAQDERRFFSYWGLDVACQVAKAAAASDAATPLAPARLGPLLEQWGSPWPELHETLGDLFVPLLDCFDLHHDARPNLGELLKLV